MWSWLSRWFGRRPVKKREVQRPNEPVREREPGHDVVRADQPPERHRDLDAALRRAEKARRLLAEGLQEQQAPYRWSYGGPTVDMSLKDEVIEVGQRLLVTLLTEPLKTGTVEQVHNWLQKGGRCLLLCTQSSSQLIDFVAAGLRGRLNCEVVDLFDTPELSGQAMQVRMPKGFTSAYRHLHLLLIPKGVKQGAPPQVPEQPHLPDAD